MRRQRRARLETQRAALMEAGRQLMNSMLPMSARLRGIEIEDVKHKLVFHTHARFTRSSEVLAIIRILRACIKGEREAPFLKSDLEMLQKALGPGPRFVATWHGRAKQGPFHIAEMGPWQWAVMHALSRYTGVLVSDPRLKEFAPIGVCDHCSGVFWRTKQGQECCSQKCRVARWSQKAGNDYFAAAQRRRRALLKHSRKTVGITEGESSEKRRKQTGKKGKKR